jgi:photosystem II stability/assembly factor-like uncharacterized protein
MAKQRWQHIDSPSTIFAIAPAGEVGWMIGTNEGVWKVVDGVCSIASEMLRPAAITAVAVSPAFPRHHFALAGAADGIARSIDEGMTWKGTQMGKVAQITQIVVTPAFHVDGHAYAATVQDGVLVSTDFGASWQPWNIGLLDKETVTVAVSPKINVDQTVLVATVHGFFRSANAGRAWREIPFPPDTAPLSAMVFIGDMLIAGSETQGLLYSPDMGNTWAKRSSFKSGQINAVAASPDGRTLAIATPTVVASTTDVGLSWMRAEGHVPEGIISVAVGNDGKLLVGTQEEGLWIYA